MNGIPAAGSSLWNNENEILQSPIDSVPKEDDSKDFFKRLKNSMSESENTVDEKDVQSKMDGISNIF